jgi:hypothetical protein
VNKLEQLQKLELEMERLEARLEQDYYDNRKQSESLIREYYDLEKLLEEARRQAKERNTENETPKRLD